MKLTNMGAALTLGATLWVAAMMIPGDTSAEELQKLQSSSASDNGTVPTLAPVESTRSGLLLEPPIDLSDFSHETFVKYSADVGANKIGKAWTTAVTALPPHKRAGAVGLTEDEVKEYLQHVSNLFDRGEAVPVSDVGLISSQEDVVRQPMFNHIAAFSNESVSVYLLAQSDIGHKGWSRFSILQDRTAKPPVDFYAEIKGQDIQFEGASCCKCHSSGALAIHPLRADLVSDVALMRGINEHIAHQPVAQFHFPENVTPPDFGEPLTLKACAECHAADGTRGPLFKINSHPIRVLVDFGHMPPEHRLTPDELTELKAWLKKKP